jgi:Leucine-rich repeat (LRR) protein
VKLLTWMLKCNIALLRALNLSLNKIDHFNCVIDKCKHIESIEFEMNKLNILPARVTNVTSLLYLNFSKNQLTDIPKSI